MGALAQQERARRESEAKKSPHVYTNEDVKKSQILTPEDKQRFTAERQNGTPPLANTPPETVTANSGPKTVPLGDVARKYRQEKLARESQEAKRLTAAPSPDPLAPASGVTAGDQSAAAAPAASRPQEIPLGDVARQFRRRQAAETVKPPSEFPLPASFAPLASPLPVERSISPASHPVYTNVPAEPRSLPGTGKTSGRAAAPAADDTVFVRKGDSLWKLSWLYLGAGARWGELLSANAWIRNPNHIAEGRRLRLPTFSIARGSATTLRVQSGDTLSKIAQVQFGRASAWICVVRANPLIRDPGRIFPGESLELPQACGRPLTSATAHGMMSAHAASAGAWSNR